MSEAGAVRELEALCRRVGVEAPAAWRQYLSSAKQWGARIDLTSAKNDTELCEILFLDAAVLIHAGWSTDRVVDVGAGVGAPTIPLLLADAARTALLVEPRRKRVAFLRSVIGVCGLHGRAEVQEARVDPDAPTLHGMPFDAALSRATFDPLSWRELGLTLGGEVLVFTAGSDLDADPNVELVRTLSYSVPSTGAPRAILVFRRGSAD